MSTASARRSRSGPVPLRLSDAIGASPLSLPRPLTSFIARDRELAEVLALLRRDGVRLVTLSGPGGVGKTRLAIRVAEETAGYFPGGVWFVPLAAVQDPRLVASAIAQVLGVRETGET